MKSSALVNRQYQVVHLKMLSFLRKWFLSNHLKN
uniref:Uncharacterized protein n=1 Tax=Anguilla anguilla TaxID=7936 RepID=A0A0E9QAE0_ANGAN